MTYEVRIKETLETTVTVEAASPAEAEEKVEQQWDDADFVLGAEEFTGVTFHALPVCPICGQAYSEHPALSRIDNKTEICPDCGVAQAIEAAGFSGEVKEAILDKVRKVHN